jgi:siroheme synthase
VRSATTADQVVLRCRLDELGASALESPAVIVIGAVAAFEFVGEVPTKRAEVSAIRRDFTL